MKTIVWINGDSHDYTIDAVLWIPDAMTREAFSDLWKQFDRTHYTHVQNQKFEIEMLQNDIVRAAGYEGNRKDELFVSWLCRHHGVKRIAFEVW